jgi:hypothetical protein
MAGPGPIASYSMDAGAGTALADLSGNANNGTLSGATWTTSGRHGGALSFNGSSNLVTVPDSASLDLTTGMTQEAWVRPAALGSDWRTVLLKERPGGMSYDLYAHGTPSVNVPTGEINLGGADQTASGTAALSLNVWTHLATTYDGATLRLYVNGTQVGQKAVSGPILTSTGALRIGGNTVYGGEHFSGLIDEVRIYNRALTAAEIQDDMNLPIGPADTQAPTAPASLTATGSVANAQLIWSAATDNVAVVRYNVHRSTSSGFTPSAANRIAQPTGTSYTDTSPPGTYYYKVTAEDGAGNVSGASNQAGVTVITVAPTGLVAAYGFDAGTGTSAADQSGNGNTGTLSNAAWAPGGKCGAALAFNGTNARVNVADSASLHLTTGMTMEAWVRPTILADWRTVVFKERTGY